MTNTIKEQWNKWTPHQKNALIEDLTAAVMQIANGVQVHRQIKKGNLPLATVYAIIGLKYAINTNHRTAQRRLYHPESDYNKA